MLLEGHHGALANESNLGPSQEAIPTEFTWNPYTDTYLNKTNVEN